MRTLNEIKPADTFKVGDIEFIKIIEDGDNTVAVTKDLLFNSVFGNNNNLAESEILNKLRSDILPKIEAVIGADNLVEFDTDLTSLDGLKPYPALKSKISLPTFDFYRANVEIFDKYKLNNWWWLATPESANLHGNDRWIVCVSPSGVIRNDNYSNFYYGVRPILHLKSSILVS